jgi:23S rRNA pseudouridine2457 synthase
MAKLLLFNKPYRVLSQFTDTQGRATLSDFIATPDVYPAGRLDYDSEGLLLLTDDGTLQNRIADPEFGHWKTYLVQLEGSVDQRALAALRAGPTLADGPTGPAHAREVEPPSLWPRTPPVRIRHNRPTSWIELRIREGRNRQVRRMCAAVGFPVLRLVRTRVGDWSLDALLPGQSRLVAVHLPVDPPKNRPGNPSQPDRSAKIPRPKRPRPHRRNQPRAQRGKKP